MSSKEATPPKVFISYSHDSPEHEERVLELAHHLSADGIDCMIDQYIDSPLKAGRCGWIDRFKRPISSS